MDPARHGVFDFTRFTEPVEVGGLAFPRFGEVTWRLDDGPGPFTYWRGEITDVRLIDRP